MLRITNAVKELGIKTIESSSKLGVTAGETAVVIGNTVKVGAEIVEVGAKTVKEGVGVAEEVAKAVKNRAGNITKVGLNTGKKTLEIASSTTGAVAALSSSIESRTIRMRNKTILKTNIERQAGNTAKNKLIQQKSQKIEKNANLQIMKNNIDYKEKLQKILDKDKILMKKSFDTILLNLVELKDIVCNNKYSIIIYKSKCIYTIKNFKLKIYQNKINQFIKDYQKCYDNLIKQFELKLTIYINNRNTKKEFEKSKLDIANATYEISIFLQLINYSIIQIFSNINTKTQNITNNQNKELDKIYNMIDNDIRNRLNIKKLSNQNNSLAEIISYQVKNNKRINNKLNNGLNNGLNNVRLINNSQNNPKEINKILKEINLNNLSNNISNELNLTKEQIENLKSKNIQKKYKVITELMKSKKTRDILLKNKTIRSKLSNENIEKLSNENIEKL